MTETFQYRQARGKKEISNLLSQRELSMYIFVADFYYHMIQKSTSFVVIVKYTCIYSINFDTHNTSRACWRRRQRADCRCRDCELETQPGHVLGD